MKMLIYQNIMISINKNGKQTNLKTYIQKIDNCQVNYNMLWREKNKINILVKSIFIQVTHLINLYY